MKTHLLAYIGLGLTGSSAWACPPGEDCVVAKASEEAAVTVDPRAVSLDPRHLEGHCSYSTTAMIGRVLDKGDDWSLEGALRGASPLAHDVAAPYVVGPDDTRVLANAVLDRVATSAAEPGRVLRMTGKRLVHQGVAYVVLVEASSHTP